MATKTVTQNTMIQTKWAVADSWTTRPSDKKFGRDRVILVLSVDDSQPSICHIASIPVDAPQAIHDRELAHAKMIAAAPDLLRELSERFCDACHDMIGLPPSEHPPCRACYGARAAIAKARAR